MTMIMRRIRPCPAWLSGAMLIGLLLVASLAGLSGCGDPEILVANDAYEPRIVVEGVLIAGQPVKDIRVTRNVRLEQNLNRTPLTLFEAQVSILDEDSGKQYDLRYHQGNLFIDQYFEYTGKDLQIRPGGTYTLQVDAIVDQAQLSTRATTTVPEAGFEIVGISRASTPYRPVGPDGEPEDLTIDIERSPGTRFYLLTIQALSASQTNFIYDNPFTDESPGGVDIDDFNFEWEWLQNTPAGAGQSRMNIFWWDVWFYSRYEIIIYAADTNYSSFLQTFDDVQEDDGNFHEPEFRLEGDGMGYFGSAIADTVMLEVTR